MEISSFLSEMDIKNDIESIDGISVIHAHTYSKGKTISIISVPVKEGTIKDARDLSRHISSLADKLTIATGHRPLIITEDRWKSQADMTRSRLLAHLEIFTQLYARNCEVRKIDKKTAAEFLKEHHSYGDASCRYRYGLYIKRHTGHNSGSTAVLPGCLVAVATFSNGRRWLKGDKTIRSYEWTRYSSLPEVRLNGGMGRLLKAFITEVRPDDIMTYADLEWSEGKVYEALGFTLEGWKPPVTFRIDTSEWSRTPISSDESTTCRYYQNFGSNKYRLKLTEY